MDKKLYIKIKFISIAVLFMLISSTLSAKQTFNNDEIFMQDIKDTTVSLIFNNGSISDILFEIQKQTNINFVYFKEDLEDFPLQTINVKNKPLTETLFDMFNKTKYGYKIRNNSITIIKKDVQPQVEEKSNEVSVNGKVLDEGGKPVIGATVIVLGTSKGSITDQEGRFILTTKIGDVIEVSFIGLKTATYKILKAESNLTIKMKQDVEEFDDVIVIGYGTRKKGTISGSVGVVKAEAVENTPTASFAQALQGSVAGLSVMSSSGEPSAAPSFNIRGVNSINAGTEPLFILDGVAISGGDFSSINPNDIASMSVLKDASSTSIYGARAANGVVVITTKKGRIGDNGAIKVRAQMGFSNLAYGNWNQMNTAQRLGYEEEIGLRMPGTYDKERLSNIDINWRDVVFNNNAPLKNYEVSTSGATEKFNYFISGSYYDQEGIAVGSDFNRYSVRSNLEVKVKSWFKAGVNIAFSSENIEETESGEYVQVHPISASKFMMPYWDPYKEDGSFTSTSDDSWKGTGDNPLDWLYNNPRHINKAKLIGSAFLEFTPIKNVKIRTLGGLDYSNANTDLKSNPSYTPNQGSGVAGRSNAETVNLTWTNTINYVNSFSDSHNINVLVGQEAVSNQYDAFSVMARGQNNDKLLNLSSGTIATNWSSSISESSYLSLFARGEYNYMYKYYVDLSVRRDGSSKFGDDSKWATFWSLGTMWNAKSESFLKDISWLTNAQLSFSIGTSGNSSIPNYDHLALVAAGAQYAGQAAIVPITKGNKDLTWEKLRSTNIGIKLGFWDKLNTSIEFYDKLTTDMLMSIPVSYGTGFGYKWGNIGAMVNRGVELSVDYNIFSGKQVVWNVNTQVSYNKNEIKELYNGLDEYILGTYGLLLKVGEPYGEFHQVRYAGVNPANGDALWLDKNGEVVNKYNENDRVLTGHNFIAPWQGSFGTSVRWKGISLTAQFNWVADRYMMNNDRYFDESNGRFTNFNQSTKLLDRWKNVGDIAEIPKHGILTEFDSNLIEDASFLRLKNLTISYDFSPALMSKLKILNQVRIYAQGQNLWTLTGFSGLDPESSSQTYQAAYPLARQFSFGIDITF